jgi:predicted RNA-binding Zn-ribbon protein involved in translation (DUF1610 family)
MTLYQPPTAPFNWIVQRPCPKCGADMVVVRIEPDAPGHDRRTFNCPVCTHSETMVVKFE